MSGLNRNKRIGYSVVRTLVSGLAATVVAGCAITPTEPVKKAPYTARSGQDQVAGTYAFWNSSCNPKSFEVQIVKPPSHGQLVMKPAKRVIPKNPGLGSALNCAGKVVDGTRVVYRSIAGYTGEDDFIIRLSSDAGEKALHHRIKVVP